MVRLAGGRPYPMTAILWLPPLARALATALLVVSASALAEALGPFWGALAASLPVSAGPTYVFLAMQHKHDFLAASALSSFAANAATGLFLMAYGYQARRASLLRSLGLALAAWFAASLVIQHIAWTPAMAFLLNLAVYGAGFLLLNAIRRDQPVIIAAMKRKWFDLPIRAAAVACFVSLVSAASSIIGPNATGAAAMFPVTLVSIIIILQPRIGGPASSLFAASALPPMFGFGMMLLAVHLALGRWGTATAFSIALAVFLIWSAALLLVRSIASHEGSRRPRLYPDSAP
jgi:hypothetical protein